MSVRPRSMTAETLDGRDAPGRVVAVEGDLVTVQIGPIRLRGAADQFEPWSQR